MSAALQMTQHHDAAEVTNMQRVGGGVGTQVGRHHLLLQEFFCAWHDLCQHSAPAEFFNKILHIVFFSFF